mgnify:CR=1 FL=1
MSEIKAYVGNLSFDTTESDLREAVEAHGVKTRSVNIITDRETGRPRGFGFVEFETNEDLQKIIDAMDGKDLGGRNLKVNKSEERKPRRDNNRGGGGYRGNSY